MNKNIRNELDFEIQFFEGVLKKSPAFVDIFVILGELYTRRGLFSKGLAIDKKLVLLRPKDAIVFYNLACSYSLMDDLNAALKAFKLAVKYGYSEFEHVAHDSDLDNLWKDERFKRLMRKIRKEHRKDIQYCSE